MAGKKVVAKKPVSTHRFVTKYWRTMGITYDKGSLEPDGYFYYGTGWQRVQVPPSNNHETYEEALQRVEELRSRKLASLKKQIEKVRGLVFRDPSK